MLQLRPNCECCDRDLPPQSRDALICTFECTFCSDCVASCQPQALLRAEDQPPWSCKAVIGEDCLPRQGVECRVCGDFCDARAIRFPPRLGGSPLPAVDETRCTGCGACVAPCPTAAIAISLPLPSPL